MLENKKIPPKLLGWVTSVCFSICRHFGNCEIFQYSAEC